LSFTQAQKKSPKRGQPRPFRKPTPERLANIALYYLSRYAATEASLRRVLENRVRRAAMQDEVFRADHEAQVALAKAIDALVEKHKSLGVINDKAFAEMKVGSLRRAGRSARAISQKLATKGVKADLVATALDQNEQEEGGDQEMKAALQFAQRRKLGPYRAAAKAAGDDDTADEARKDRVSDDREDRELAMKRKNLAMKLKNKEVAVMARAGFSFDIIRHVLNADVAEE
jgi:regulatory protein